MTTYRDGLMGHLKFATFYPTLPTEIEKLIEKSLNKRFQMKIWKNRGLSNEHVMHIYIKQLFKISKTNISKKSYGL